MNTNIDISVLTGFDAAVVNRAIEIINSLSNCNTAPTPTQPMQITPKKRCAPYFTPTGLGRLVGSRMSGVRVNTLLVAYGLQTCHPEKDGYLVTEKGASFSKTFKINSQNRDNILWHTDVLKLIANIDVC